MYVWTIIEYCVLCHTKIILIANGQGSRLVTTYDSKNAIKSPLYGDMCKTYYKTNSKQEAHCYEKLKILNYLKAEYHTTQ